MELQLGLALSTNQSQSLDLNSHAYDSIFPFRQNNSNKKRAFFQFFDHAPQTLHTDLVLPTLSLLPLTPSHHQDDHDQHSQCSSIAKKDEEGEEDAEDIVGWPPVNYWRKKLRVDHDEVVGKNDHVVWVDRCHRHGSNSSKSLSLSVKVKMEGVGIARKVDLSMHQSFETLMETLMDMFGTGRQESNSYELAYQDKEGDWLLAQDVAWRSFVGCAQRLKLMKKSNRYGDKK